MHAFRFVVCFHPQITSKYFATQVRHVKGGVIVNLPFISKTAFCPYGEISVGILGLLAAYITTAFRPEI